MRIAIPSAVLEKGVEQGVVEGWILGNGGGGKTLQCGGEEGENTRGGGPDLGEGEGEGEG